jgi:hypothetical protein
MLLLNSLSYVAGIAAFLFITLSLGKVPTRADQRMCKKFTHTCTMALIQQVAFFG